MVITQAERVYCRNLRCRTKLTIPTDNHHKAFCSPYCYNQFYQRKCIVCEKELPRGGRARKLCRSHKCRLDYRKFRPAYVLSESVGLPQEPNGNSDAKNPYNTGTIFPLAAGGDWHWEDHPSDRWLHEHYLFLRGEHVVTIVGKEGDYRIVERRLIPAQTATTLEAAKKLALNVALWTFGLNSRRKTRPKPAQPPINLIGGYRFQGAELDPDLRRDIIVTESDADWLDWPPSDGDAE
jgi:hypothetical protein